MENKTTSCTCCKEGCTCGDCSTCKAVAKEHCTCCAEGCSCGDCECCK